MMMKGTALKRNANSGRRLGTRGESMIVAVVLMLVFFILGLAVLTGASVANASVNARVRYRQAYYYARSTLDLLDDSLRGGALGEYLCELERQRLAEAGTNEVRLEEQRCAVPLSFGANGPAELGYADGQAVVTYDVVSQRINANLMSISLENVALSFRAVYAGRTYGVLVTYAYAGFVERIGEEWVWTGDWRIRSMS